MKYSAVGLYEHNEISYDKIKKAFETSDIVGIVHATGTGKSYNGMQLCYDNADKKIIYIAPYISIIEYVKTKIEENPNLDINKDFRNVTFKTCQSFLNLSKEEMKNIPCDIVIIDEFIHLGAPIWGQRIKTFIELHPGVKVLGLTAYTTRERGTSYEKDMIDPYTDELFSNKIVSTYSLCDAMIDKVLPKPIYKSAYVELKRMLESIKKKASFSADEEINKLLDSAKKRVHQAPSAKDLVLKSVKRNGKYIYFCPPYSETGVNDIESIKKEVYSWFKTIMPEGDIVFYTSTSQMGKLGGQNRKAFYNDLDLNGNDVKNKLRIMFAINQYNEGIHAPNVDGVIMGRETSSDIVFFEQLGRALSVRGDTKAECEKLEKLSYEELLQMCEERDLLVKENSTKEDLIEYLLAPVVIDLVGNFKYIKNLENELRDKVNELQNKAPREKREIKLKNPTFDIKMENENIFKMLEELNERLLVTWDEIYKYAKKYYDFYGNLDVPETFKTNDGINEDENGRINLGLWVSFQRKHVIEESMRGQMLAQIGMKFEQLQKKHTWEELYEYAKIYYKHNGNLNVLSSFKTDDGFTYNKNGKINLGLWIVRQRAQISEESTRGQMLAQIGMCFKKKYYKHPWEEMYEYAKRYYDYYGNLDVIGGWRTDDGITEKKDGNISLGNWVKAQKIKISPDSERGKLLSQIGFKFIQEIDYWAIMYEYAKKYYLYHGNLEVRARFKTNNGYTYDKNGKINLGTWISQQRSRTSEHSKRGQMLLQIGMRFENINYINRWEEIYEYAKKYYEYYGNLDVPLNWKTDDGITEKKDGKITLGNWIKNQRFKTLPNSEHGKLLLQIGMDFNKKENYIPWKKMYKYAEKYYQHYGNLDVPETFKTDDGITKKDDGFINLGNWVKKQSQLVDPNSPKGILLSSIGMSFTKKKILWDTYYEYAKKYYIYYGNLDILKTFRTNDGIHANENGKINLGQWIEEQRKSILPESERGELLKKIGMNFGPKKMAWKDIFKYAKKYYSVYGNLDMSEGFKTNDGYSYDENGIIHLDSWLKEQKQNVKPNSDKGKLLSSIGIEFEDKVSLWDEYYKLASIFYKKHGCLSMPISFKTTNGYTYSPRGKINLGLWVSVQKRNINPESQLGRLLSQIGLDFNSMDAPSEMYEYAKVYYEHYKCLVMPYNFITNDGFTYDEKGKINLGSWVINKRNTVNPESDEGKFLSSIGMVWNIKKHLYRIQALCVFNKIDMAKNKKVLSSISLSAFTAKINFLKENGVPLTNDEGILNEIFSLNNANLKLKYGFSLDELILTYGPKVSTERSI